MSDTQTNSLAERLSARFGDLLKITVSHGQTTGQARVMWNRILAERVESGFLVLAAQE